MKFVNDHQIVLYLSNGELDVRNYVMSVAGNTQVQSSGKYVISDDGLLMAYVQDFDTVVIV